MKADLDFMVRMLAGQTRPNRCLLSSAQSHVPVCIKQAACSLDVQCSRIEQKSLPSQLSRKYSHFEPLQEQYLQDHAVSHPASLSIPPDQHPRQSLTHHLNLGDWVQRRIFECEVQIWQSLIYGVANGCFLG